MEEEIRTETGLPPEAFCKPEETTEVTEEKVLMVTQHDPRFKNWLLALRLLLREIKGLNDTRIDAIFARYKVTEIGGEIDNYPRTALEFPDDISRVQFYVNENGQEFVKYIEGKKVEYPMRY